MNDAVVHSRKVWARQEPLKEGLLFEMRSEEIIPDIARIQSLVIEELTQRMPRGHLIIKVMQREFGMFTETQIRRTVTELIESGHVKSESGRARINDEEQVWIAQS